MGGNENKIKIRRGLSFLYWPTLEVSNILFSIFNFITQNWLPREISHLWDQAISSRRYRYKELHHNALQTIAVSSSVTMTSQSLTSLISQPLTLYTLVIPVYKLKQWEEMIWHGKYNISLVLFDIIYITISRYKIKTLCMFRFKQLSTCVDLFYLLQSGEIVFLFHIYSWRIRKHALSCKPCIYVFLLQSIFVLTVLSVKNKWNRTDSCVFVEININA